MVLLEMMHRIDPESRVFTLDPVADWTGDPVSVSVRGARERGTMSANQRGRNIWGDGSQVRSFT